MVAGYLELLRGVYKGKSEDGIGSLNAGDGKVPDGVRYHVLDVWIDGLMETNGWERVDVMEPVERLRREGRTKVVRDRARAVLEDERLQGIEEGTEDGRGERERDEESDFEGFTE